MATDINRLEISGNLIRDPEMRSTQSGMTVLSFCVAVNDRVKNNQTNEWEDHPNFVDCTMFGKRAESVGKYLGKGVKVFIAGKLRHSTWEDREGNKRSKLEAIVDDIVFTGNGQNGQQGGYQQPQTYQQPQQYAPSPQFAAPQQAQSYQQQGGYQQQMQYAPQPAQAVQQQMPVIDARASVYDDDIPF